MIHEGVQLVYAKRVVTMFSWYKRKEGWDGVGWLCRRTVQRSRVYVGRVAVMIDIVSIQKKTEEGNVRRDEWM
jgi:hypothetical protein